MIIKVVTLEAGTGKHSRVSGTGCNHEAWVVRPSKGSLESRILRKRRSESNGIPLLNMTKLWKNSRYRRTNLEGLSYTTTKSDPKDSSKCETRAVENPSKITRRSTTPLSSTILKRK